MSAKQLLSSFNQNTSIPVKILVPVLGMAAWIIALLYDIRDIQRENWTVHNQDKWSSEVSRLNPGFKTPSAYDVKYRDGLRKSSTPISDVPVIHGAGPVIPTPTPIKSSAQ